MVKAEMMNPGGSVKDRAAYYLIKEAEARGEIQPGGTIVEGKKILHPIVDFAKFHSLVHVHTYIISKYKHLRYYLFELKISASVKTFFLFDVDCESKLKSSIDTCSYKYFYSIFFIFFSK